jgi:hypothetical protein
LFYTLDLKAGTAQLAFSNGLTPVQINLAESAATWPLAEIAGSGKPIEATDLAQRFGVFPKNNLVLRGHSLSSGFSFIVAARPSLSLVEISRPPTRQSRFTSACSLSQMRSSETSSKG